MQLNDASLNTTAGRSLIQSIKTASTTTKTVLTPLVRIASTSTSGTTNQRAAVRFECELHPTAAEITAFRNGTLTWDDVAWPQGLVSSHTGLRQVWLRTELQLMSQDYSDSGVAPADAVPMPFLGSATLYYSLTK